MESKAKALGHPIHQMLIPFPFGLLSTAVIFDIVYLIWGNPTMTTVSYWMIVAGIIGGIIAATLKSVHCPAHYDHCVIRRVAVLGAIATISSGAFVTVVIAAGEDASSPPATARECPNHPLRLRA